MTLLPRLLTAIALIGLLTMAAPPTWTEAQAQSKAAKDLKCKGCVGKKDLGKKAVKMKNLDKKLQNKINEMMMNANRVPFSQQIAANTTATLLTLGPFVLFARCILGQGGDDRVELALRSTVNNWFLGGFLGSGSPFLSTEEVILGTLLTIAGAQAYETFLRDGAISPAGAFLGLIYFGLALNVVGNGCFVHGTVGYDQGA